MADKKTVRSLVAASKKLMDQAIERLDVEYPHGTRVHWRHGDAVLSADVVGHSQYTTHLKVLGRTGSEYWIDESRVVSKDLP